MAKSSLTSLTGLVTTRDKDNPSTRTAVHRHECDPSGDQPTAVVTLTSNPSCGVFYLLYITLLPPSVVWDSVCGRGFIWRSRKRFFCVVVLCDCAAVTGDGRKTSSYAVAALVLLFFPVLQKTWGRGSEKKEHLHPVLGGGN